MLVGDEIPYILLALPHLFFCTAYRSSNLTGLMSTAFTFQLVTLRFPTSMFHSRPVYQPRHELRLY